MSDTPILVGTSEPPDPSKSIRIGFDEIADMLALLRDPARGTYEWEVRVDALLARIDGVTPA